MNSLSAESKVFLRQLGQLSAEERREDVWKLQYTRLFCEFYELIGHVNSSLRELHFGSWSLSYEGDNNQTLAFTFSLNYLQQRGAPKILITIEPLGTSSIEVIPGHQVEKKDECTNSMLFTFFNSPAYKRYFAPYASKEQYLKTTIPVKQLTSRHLGEYFLHLFKMMQPFIQVICDKPSQVRQAA